MLQIISEVYQKRIGGATLISMVNSDRLGEIGITRLNRVQLLWNLEVCYMCMSADDFLSNDILYHTC